MLFTTNFNWPGVALMNEEESTVLQIALLRLNDARSQILGYSGNSFTRCFWTSLDFAE